MIYSQDKPEMCKCQADYTDGTPYCQNCGLLRDHNMPEGVNHGFATLSKVL